MTGIFRRRDVAGSDDVTISGTARVDERTKRLVTRLSPGDIAVIDHEDIDQVAAESLVAAQPAAVLNAAASSSGRYPNEGPLLLLRAGIPLVDGIGADLMATLSDGDVVTISGDEVVCGDVVVGSGVREDEAAILEIHERSKSTLA
ncbi:MAG: hypothetical protein JST64_08915, partial [Actinobacteria bacterium]|nr:hypothetical protein [Actinomycetota bacterium]